jgi:galactose mutarotase-like enzyme
LSVILKNGVFGAKIMEKGAELKSLASLASGQEYLWPGDPAWWTGSAPVLFPIVGSLRNGTYTHEGHSYALSNHGFARGSEFAVERETDQSAMFLLASSPATRSNYPFDFELRVGFTLQTDGMAVTYTVLNTGKSRMYFSIGSHPGFVVPFAGGALENYYVLFDREESAERWFIKDGLIDAGRTLPVFDTTRMIGISRSVFDEGGLVFKHLRSRSFSLRNSINAHSVTVVTEGAPYFALWAKPGAPYVCIEPWHGISDSTDASGVLAEKEGILFLDPHGSFETGYRIVIS